LGYCIVGGLLLATGSIRGLKNSRDWPPGPSGIGTEFNGDREDPKKAAELRSADCRYRGILGVSETAPELEIKAAYRVVSKCHPDKVAHFGGEFYDVATRRTMEIIEAYERLKNSYAFKMTRALPTRPVGTRGFL
jgi:hypothetical protein